MFDDKNILVDMRCKCGQAYGFSVSPSVWDDPLMQQALIDAACCGQCRERNEREQREIEQKQELEARKAELALSYSRRYAASNLDKYRMSYDPQHPGANPELFEFVGANIDYTLWLAGHTGLCKTRILHHFAVEAMKTRSVVYWPCNDLMNYLSTNSKIIHHIIQQILQAELLIIDDVGKETVTEAKLKYLFHIVDRRYNAWDQLKKLNSGKLNPLWLPRRKEGRLGAQLWLSTNDDGSEVKRNMGPLDGPPFIRRLQEMSEVWEKF